MFRLVYRSHSAIPVAERTAGLGEIFATARRNNKDLDVTGALMISDGAFVQVLEGDEAAVRALYARISADDRHQDVTLLKEQSVDGRTFGRWAMAKVASDGGADIRLLSNADKGVIVALPGTDTSITDEQEEILAFMRETLALDHA
jgi:Sensors of blue-light using FAD